MRMSSSARGIGVFVLAALAACAACSPPGSLEAGEGQGEDELRFRRVAVDASLPDVDALGYEVALRVDDVPGREAFRVDVTGTYVATRALDELVLDLEGNTVDSVIASGVPAEHRREGDKLVIVLPSRVPRGRTFTTRVTLHGDVRQTDRGSSGFTGSGGLMVRQHNADGRKIFSSLNWPTKARGWLPVRDHPSDGAAVAFDVTFPSAYRVVANGEKLGEADNADGTKTWRYEAADPMPTYDFHVAAYDDWNVVEARSSSGVPITTYTYASDAPRAPAIYGDLGEALGFYEATFGAYRWGSASFLEVPNVGGGMEHASVVSMDEDLFSSTQTARDTAFHELAHHWSGNLVRIRQWNDFWLSEGFTEYLTARAIGAVYGADEMKRVFRGYVERALAADRANPHALAPRGVEIDVLTIFDGISYQKGALVLRMLERIVGEPELTAFLKRWFDRHAFQAVSTDDLERELSEAAGRDLSGFFASFVYAGSHPELRVGFAPSSGGETEVKVEQLQAGGPDQGFQFPLDLDFVDAAGATERVTVDLTGKTTTKRVRLTRAPMSVVVDPDAYALVATVR